METIRTNFSAILCAGILCAAHLGCDSADDSTAGKAQATASGDAGFKLVVSVNEEGKNTATNEFMNPSLDLLRKQFQGIDWTDSTKQTAIVLQTLSGSDTVKISQPDDSQTLMAAWSEKRENVSPKWKHLYCEPISEAKALDLLASLLAQDDRHRSMIEWKTED